MSDKASGNGTEGRRDDDQELDSTNTPEGEELSIDPESGDQLDPTDRWWDDSDSDGREGKGNRRLTEEERAAAEAAKETEKESEEVELHDSELTDSEEELIDTEEVDVDSSSDEESPKEESSDEEDGFDEAVESEAKSEGKGEELKVDSEEGEIEEKPVDVGALIKKLEPVEGLDEILGDDVDEESEEEERPGDPMPWEQDDEEVDESSEEEKEDSATAEDESDKEEDSNTSKTDSPKKKAKKDKATIKVDLKDEATLVVEQEDSEEAEPTKEDKDQEDKGPDLGLGKVIANPALVERAEAPKKKKAGCWTVFATIFFILTLLVVLAIGVVGYIGWTKLGVLESEITSKAQTKLEEKGIFVDYQGWKYQFPRGLVLKGVTLFKSEAREVPQLKLSDLGINIDIVSLIKDRTSVDAAEISFQDSTLTFFQEGSSVAELEEIDAEVLASAEEIDLERFSGRIGGLVVRASGSMSLQEPAGAESDGDVGGVSTPFVLPVDFALLEKLRPWLDVQAGSEPPVLDVKFSSDGAADSLVLGGSLNGSDFVWHGVPVTRASASFSYNAPGNSLEVYTFQVGHGDGSLSGVASLDLDSMVLKLGNAQSNVDLIAILSAFDPGIAEKLKGITFRDAPSIQLSGSIPIEDVANSDVIVIYDHLLGIVYTKDSRELPVSRIKSRIKLSDGTLTLEDTAGRVLDGDLNLGGTMRLVADGYPFSINTCKLSGLPLNSVAKYFELDSLGMDGDVEFEFRGSGSTDLAKVRGGGSILIEEAKLTAFPVIGKIQDFLGKVIPAFGVRKGDSLTGVYIIESGILLTNDLTISQVGAKVVVNGSVKLKPQTISFTATASMDPSVVTGTVLEGKSVTISGEGPLSEPEIRLKDFPVEFAAEELSSMLGTSPETLDRLKDLVEGEEDVAKTISEQLQEVVGDEDGSPGVQGLINGILGTMPHLPETGEETANPDTPESAETLDAPDATEASSEAPVTPVTPAPFRATPVGE